MVNSHVQNTKIVFHIWVAELRRVFIYITSISVGTTSILLKDHLNNMDIPLLFQYDTCEGTGQLIIVQKTISYSLKEISSAVLKSQGTGNLAYTLKFTHLLQQCFKSNKLLLGLRLKIIYCVYENSSKTADG